MSSNRYKYETLIDAAVVNPMWEKNTAKVYDRVPGRVFHRETLAGGGIELLRPDNDVLEDAVIDHEFDLAITRRNSAGTYDNYMLGKFHKTDCKYNEDQRRHKIVPKPLDRYNKILADYDKEFDLISDLAPPVHSVNYVKEPMIQVAFPGHNQIYNQIGHSSFVTTLSDSYTTEELESFGFTKDEAPRMFIPGSADMVPDVSGIYEYDSGPDNYIRLDGEYVFEAIVSELLPYYRIYHISDYATTLYQTNVIPDSGFLVDGGFFHERASPFSADDYTLFKVGDLSVQCMPFPFWNHYRVLTDAAEIDSTPTIAVPSPDISELDFGYDNYIDVDGVVNPYVYVIPSDDHTVVATEHGRFAENALHFAGEFFDVTLGPAPLTFNIFQESWTQYSIIGKLYLLVDSHADERIEARSIKTLHHAYKLQDVWRALLSKIDPAISFLDDVNYSEFLFSGTNPVTGDVQAHTHFITPKSNIIVDDYDNPASKAKITLGQVDDLIRNGLDLHWWIDPSYMQQIEHISYFNNGRSYLAQVVSNNLTIQENPQNDKPWAYHTRSYEFKKETMPERIEYSWMDKSNRAFDGYPIEIISGYVEKGNVENRSISIFSTDINQINANNDGITKDGFCVLKATPVDDVFTVDYDDVRAFGSAIDPISIQNGYWSFMFLHPLFHKHNLPAPDIRLNNEVTTAETVKRGRMQEVIYPSPIEPDVMRLITTSLGIGEIEKMSVNLTTRAVTLTVLHDNE